MADALLFILLVALVLDWFFGEPEFLWSRLPHPVVLFGKAVSAFDKRLNHGGDSSAVQYRRGAFSITALIVLALLTGLLLNAIMDWLGPIGWVIEIFIVFVLLAQNSLFVHVKAVAEGLAQDGLDRGRKAVGMIVGRNPEYLDQSGVCRAGIESLAENFSDGVVAPAFWYAIFGIPGLITYKMINTADSMIAYQNEKYLWFGRVAAKIDDLANWVPARISAVLIACSALMLKGAGAGKQSLICALRDSGLHRSPNAGWPEAAMAGAIDVALGGPRKYEGEDVAQAYLNSSGERSLAVSHIEKALDIFAMACFSLWLLVVLFLLF